MGDLNRNLVANGGCRSKSYLRRACQFLSSYSQYELFGQRSKSSPLPMFPKYKGPKWSFG